jgi:hypothetical protein
MTGVSVFGVGVFRIPNTCPDFRPTSSGIWGSTFAGESVVRRRFRWRCGLHIFVLCYLSSTSKPAWTKCRS